MNVQTGVRCLVSLGLASVIVAGARANVISNGGFELGSGADATDWGEIIGGPAGNVSRSNAMPNSGSFSAFLEVDHINNLPAGGAYFIEQITPANSIDSSVNFDLSFSAKVDSSDFTGIDTFFQLLWLDQDNSDGGGVQGETLVSLVGEGINTDYQTFGIDDIDVPDTADSVLLRFQLSAGPVQGIDNGLYIDDVSLTSVIPEPGSLLLVVMAGASALPLRRRR